MSQKKSKINIGLLLLFIFGSILAGSSGSVFTYPQIPSWYASLNKPWFNPPNWIFGPVWTFLFGLMGYSAFLVFTSGKNPKTVGRALTVFAVQFAFNILWSYLFFGLNSPLLGILGITLLYLSILINIIVFYEISKAAGYLLMPYLTWVSFAAILNTAIFLMN